MKNIPDTEKNAFFITMEPTDKPTEITWLEAHMAEQRHTPGEMARRLYRPNGQPYSPDTLRKALTGARETASLGPLCEAIRTYRESLANPRPPAEAAQVVHTGTVQQIAAVCSRAASTGKICLVFGPSQIGKTAALAHVAATSPSHSAVHVRVPVGPTPTSLLAAMCEAAGLDASGALATLRRRLHAVRKCWLLDEFHQVFTTCSKGALTIKCVELLRELNDIAAGGMVLCGTKEVRDQIAAGRHHEVLQQIHRRRLINLALPLVPPVADLAQFAQAFGLAPVQAGEPAAKLQRDVTSTQGLGLWLTILTTARTSAQKRSEPLTWNHVLSVHAALEKLANPTA